MVMDSDWITAFARVGRVISLGAGGGGGGEKEERSRVSRRRAAMG